MSTFAELKQQAADRLQDPNYAAVSNAQVGDAINAALRYWKQRRFWFNEVNETITLTQNSAVLPVLNQPLLFLNKMDGMRIIYQNYSYPLTVVSPEWYDLNNISQTGRPTAFTWRAGAYYLYYTPDQAYTLQATGVRDYDDLSGDADSNGFTEQADQLILYDALSRLTAELRTDPSMSEYYTNRREDERKNLVMRTNQMISTGRARVYEDMLYNNYSRFY